MKNKKSILSTIAEVLEMRPHREDLDFHDENIRLSLNRKRNLFVLGVVGKTGVGKTSFINSTFNLSPSLPEGKGFTNGLTQHQINFGNNSSLIIKNFPSFEDRIDKSELQKYQFFEELHECDCIVWIINGNDIALKGESELFKNLSNLDKRKLIFAISKVANVSPNDWNDDENMPSPKQSENIKNITLNIRQIFSIPLNKIICFDNLKKYNISTLVTSIFLNSDIPNSDIIEDVINEEYKILANKAQLYKDEKLKTEIKYLENAKNIDIAILATQVTIIGNLLQVDKVASDSGLQTCITICALTIPFFLWDIHFINIEKADGKFENKVNTYLRLFFWILGGLGIAFAFGFLCNNSIFSTFSLFLASFFVFFMWRVVIYKITTKG